MEINVELLKTLTGCKHELIDSLRAKAKNDFTLEPIYNKVAGTLLFSFYTLEAKVLEKKKLPGNIMKNVIKFTYSFDDKPMSQQYITTQRVKRKLTEILENPEYTEMGEVK